MSTPASPVGPGPGPEPAGSGPSPGRRRSLAFHRNFRQLWIGDALGQTGAQLTGLVLPVLAVQHLAATEWQMGALSAAESAAFLVIGLPTGAWVDRMRKRRVLIVADLVRALALAAVVGAALLGVASMPLLYAAAVVIGVATVFFDVAHQSYVPGLVGLEHVVEGNSKLTATQFVAAVAAPAAGGALLRVITAPVVIAFTVVTYVASAVFVGRIRHEEQLPARESRRPLLHEIGEGLGFVVRQPLLRRIVACTSIGNLFGSMSSAMIVLFVLRELGLSEVELGTFLSASAVGGIAGAVLADRITRWIGEGRVIPLSALAFAPGYALVPLAIPLADAGVPPIAALIAGGAVMNVAGVVYNVAQVSFRQRLCPPALLGRMNASVRFIVWGTMPIGALLGGALGAGLGIVPTLWLGTAGTALAALPVLLSPMLGMRDLPGPAPTPVAVPDEPEPTTGT